jgi:hypothetical protein
MVDVQTVSIAIASAGVFLAAIYYILQIRHQTRIKQTDLVMRLYSTLGSKEFWEALTKFMMMEFEARAGDYLGGWGFAPAHFYSVEELKKEFEHKKTTLQMVGVEGIYSALQRRYNQVYRQKKYNELLWETYLRTCTDPCVVGTSQHSVIVFRKRK